METEIAEKEIAAVFALANSAASTGFAGDVIGICPLCGREVVRTRRGYGCRGYKEGCRFTIWSTVAGRSISVAEAKALLTDGRTEVLEGFVSKKGTNFSARLKLEGDKVSFEFESRPRTPQYAASYPPSNVPAEGGKPIEGIPIDYSYGF